MARISKYTFDDQISGDDFLIGSDGRTKKTRNYRLEDLVEYLRNQSGLGGTGFAYRLSSPEDPKNLNEAQINFDNISGGSYLYSTISKIYINRYNVENQDVYDFLVALKEGKSGIALYTSSKLTDFGFYEIDNINIDQNNVITLFVTPALSNGYASVGNDIVVTAAFISKKDLGELEDVTLTDVENKQALVYDASTGHWINSNNLSNITAESVTSSGDITASGDLTSQNINTGTVNATEAQISNVVVSQDIVAQQIEAVGAITSATTITNLVLTPRVLSGTMVIPEEHDGLLAGTANLEGIIIISDGSTLTITN